MVFKYKRRTLDTYLESKAFFFMFNHYRLVAIAGKLLISPKLGKLNKFF